MASSASSEFSFCFASLSCALCEWCVAYVEFNSLVPNVRSRRVRDRVFAIQV